MQNDVLGSLQLSFQNLWNDVIGFLPELVIAIIIIVVGWILGGFLKGVIERAFKTLKLDQALDKAGVDDLSQRAGYKFRPGYFVGELVKWFTIIVFLVVALDVLKLNQVTEFFTGEVLTYLPRVIVAALILLGAMVLANLVSASIEAGARAAGFKAADVVGTFARYAIIVFAVLAAMSQLEIAPEMVQILFAGFVFGASLAFGLAFGLGGRDAAGKYIAKMTNQGGSDSGSYTQM